MSFEDLAVRNTLTSFGPRVTNSSFGGQIGDCVVKFASLEFGAPTTTTSTDADFGLTGLQASAWATKGIDLIIPAGAIFLKADVVVEEAFDALTALTIGTYKASDGTTPIDVDGLVAAAGSALATIDAVGDRLVGAGGQLATGTAGLGALLFDAVIRVLYTGTVPTVGKARLIVSYVMPAA